MPKKEPPGLAKGRLDSMRYVLRLYVTGKTPRSQAAIGNIKRICENELKGRYDLKVIDIYQQPALAKGERIIAIPTLIKRLPLPIRRIVGDMSDENRVLFGLDIRVEKEKDETAEGERIGKD